MFPARKLRKGKARRPRQEIIFFNRRPAFFFLFQTPTQLSVFTPISRLTFAPARSLAREGEERWIFPDEAILPEHRAPEVALLDGKVAQGLASLAGQTRERSYGGSADLGQFRALVAGRGPLGGGCLVDFGPNQGGHRAMGTKTSSDDIIRRLALEFRVVTPWRWCCDCHRLEPQHLRCRYLG